MFEVSFKTNIKDDCVGKNTSYMITVDPVEEKPTSYEINMAVDEVIEDMNLHRKHIESSSEGGKKNLTSGNSKYKLRIRERRLFVDLAFVSLLCLGALMVAYVYALFVVVEGEVKKQTIIDAVERVTGKKMEINGRVTFEAFPLPEFRVMGVRLLKGKDKDSGVFAEVKTFKVQPSIFYLFVGSVKISKMHFSGVTLNIENFIGEEPSWKSEVMNDAVLSPDKNNKGPVAIASVLKFIRTYLEFDEIAISNLKVHFLTGYRRSPVTRTVSLQTLAFDGAFDEGLYRLHGEFYAQKANLMFSYAVELLEQSSEGQEDALEMKVKIASATSEMLFEGKIHHFKKSPIYSGEFSGDFDNSIQKIRKYIVNENSAFSEMVSGLLVEGAKAHSHFKLDSNRFSLRKLSFDDENIKGAMDVDMDFGQVMTLKVNLNYDSINIDNLIDRAGKAELLSRSELFSSKKTNEIDAKVNVTDIGLPSDIDLVLRAKIDQVLYKSKKVKGVRLDLSAGDITAIRTLEILSFPGGSYVKGGGKLFTTEDGPKFKGKMALNVKSLSDLMVWMGYSAPKNIRPGVLQDFSLNTNVIITPEQVLLSKIDLMIDGSELQGRVSVEKKQNFIVKSSLIIGELDIDKYYLKSEDDVEDLNAEYVVFEFLRYIDNMFEGFSLALNVKKIRFNDKVYENLSTVASFGKGISELAGIKFNVNGEPIRGSIRLDNRQLNPEVDLIFDIHKINVKTLMSLFISNLEEYRGYENPYTLPLEFDFSKFNVIRGTIRLNVKEMIISEEDDVRFERVRLDMNVLKDALRIERFSAQGLGGNVRLNGELETGARIIGHFNYYLTNVYIKALLEQLLSVGSIEGRINSTGQIAVSGNTFRQWVRTMSGKGEVVSRGATIYGFDTEFLLKSLPKKRKSIRHVRYIVNKALTSGSSQVNYIKAVYNFVQGEVVFGPHTLTHPIMTRTSLTGAINLMKWTIDANFSFITAQSLYPIKALITGNLSNPRVDWDEKTIVKRWEDSKF